ECLRLVAKKGTLEIAGTDLEVAIRYRMAEDIDVKQEGEAVVPAALLANVLREVGDERISLAVSKQKLGIETDGGFFEIECVDPAEYPEIPGFPEAAAWKLASGDLQDLVRKTAFAAGKEAARFVLNGVRVLAEGGTIRFVATDGRRLATLGRPVERRNGTEGKPVSAIVGVKGLHHFERLAAAAGGDIEFALADRFVAVRTPHAEVVARVMEGVFPDHEQIIPKDCPNQAKLPVGMFASKLRQARQFASQETQSVALRFHAGELAIAASGGDGRADVRLGIEYDGGEERIGFNPGFLLDALKVVEGEQVTFAFRNASGAAKLLDEGGFVYVIMPVLLE
ncbi:MAG: DNA polymerase III subunit beta, partial [Planctomycetes bacterium]|nr:DNA polymerase III subunit beta [Planctomycetota bacterium]